MDKLKDRLDFLDLVNLVNSELKQLLKCDTALHPAFGFF